MTRAPVAVALDAPDLPTAARWATDVGPHVSTAKVGLELFCRHGPAACDVVRDIPGLSLFLDLKLHDIPATVGGAARALAGLEPDIVTVHAAGGPDMVAAACEALPGTTIAAVTLLTSLGAGDLSAVAIAGPPEDAVRRRAAAAVAAGAGALVCSPQEIRVLRADLGPDVMLITPGVRPRGSQTQDQRRVATPEQALSDGADLLVVGRPLTGAPDPGGAAEALARALADRP